MQYNVTDYVFSAVFFLAITKIKLHVNNVAKILRMNFERNLLSSTGQSVSEQLLIFPLPS